MVSGRARGIDAGALDAAAEKPAPQLTPTERRCLEHLSAGELDLDELIRRCALPSHEVTAAMTTLALKGLVAQRPGGIFAARSARGDG